MTPASIQPTSFGSAPLGFLDNDGADSFFRYCQRTEQRFPLKVVQNISKSTIDVVLPRDMLLFPGSYLASKPATMAPAESEVIIAVSSRCLFACSKIRVRDHILKR